MSQRCTTVGPVTFEQVAEVCNKKLGSLDFNGYGQVYFDKDQLIALINEFAVVSQSHIGTLEECARLRRNIDEMELERNQRTVPVLPDDDFAALVQCEQTMIDDNSYDLDAATMQRLADYGAVWHKGGGYYTITKIGECLLRTGNTALVEQAATKAELKAIHDVVMCIGCVEEIPKDVTYTLEGVMQMALRIQAMELELAECRKDTERIEFIANAERTTATNKWVVQVIGPNGDMYMSYFAEPPAGKPEIMYKNRLQALRATIDQAIAKSAEQ